MARSDGALLVVWAAAIAALLAAGEARAQSGAAGPGVACWARRDACVESCAGRLPDAARRSECAQSCGACPAASDSPRASAPPESLPHSPPPPPSRGALPPSRAWGSPPGTVASPAGMSMPKTTVRQPVEPPSPPPPPPPPPPNPGWGGDPGSTSGEFLLHCRGTAHYEDDADPTAWSEVLRFDSVNRTVDGHSVQSWDTTVVWRSAWGELHLDLGSGQLWSEPIVRPDRTVDAHVHAACERVE